MKEQNENKKKCPYDFSNPYNKLLEFFESWSEITRVSQKIRPSMTPTHLALMRKAYERGNKFNFPPEFILPFEELSEGKLKRQELRPDIFLTWKERIDYGLIRELPTALEDAINLYRKK